MGNTLLSVLPSYIQSVALITAGGWAYWRFVHQRGNEPACDIDIDVAFVGTQDDQWILEVTSFLTNRSLMRVEYQKLQVTLRYLMPGDKVEDGDQKLFHQLKFPRTTDERIPGGEKRFFANAEYLNPNQSFKHRYITSIPIDATFVWVQCKFAMTRKRKFRKPEQEPMSHIRVNSQRIFRVPENESGRIPAPKP